MLRPGVQPWNKDYNDVNGDSTLAWEYPDNNVRGTKLGSGNHDGESNASELL